MQKKAKTTSGQKEFKLNFMAATKHKVPMQIEKETQSAVRGTSICVLSQQKLPQKAGKIQFELMITPISPNYDLILGIACLRDDGSFTKLIGMNGAQVPS